MSRRGWLAPSWLCSAGLQDKRGALISQHCEELSNGIMAMATSNQSQTVKMRTPRSGTDRTDVTHPLGFTHFPVQSDTDERCCNSCSPSGRTNVLLQQHPGRGSFASVRALRSQRTRHQVALQVFFHQHPPNFHPKRWCNPFQTILSHGTNRLCAALHSSPIPQLLLFPSPIWNPEEASVSLQWKRCDSADSRLSRLATHPLTSIPHGFWTWLWP